ncbi:KH domain containing protein [Nitzschia inconspicua]|uniref:KH domain containing protein n=1 Tax=Nitzschia inconspicua TaxID=303405 RepID=A0A9K3PQL9_9STRA|nr:KH domain containing protein [Nitzschia inconspicua]
MTLELETTLQKRLEETNFKRDEQLANIKKLQANLQTLLKKIPRRPKESLAELDKKIEALERKRTINSVTLAEERQILKEIAAVKRIKLQVEEYHKLERQAQDLKKQLNDIRDALSETLAATDEVSAALSKVRLANKLGCQTQELTKKEVECPTTKLGKVIGKGGATISMIQESCKVVMDVDKQTQKITITGSEDSIQAAINKIDKIVQLVEEEIEIEKNLLVYLTSKYVTVIEQLRSAIPDAHVETMRSNGKLLVRGAPEDVATIKTKVLGLQLISKTIQLQGGKEASVLLGRKGATVDKLCETHAVSIEVDKDSEENTKAIIIGLPSSVDSVVKEIEDLLNDNMEATERVEISIIMKHILLSDNGRHIKAVQTLVSTELPEGINCYITVSKDSNAKGNMEVLVKTKQSVISNAVELTKSQLKAIEDLECTLTVDPLIVPRFIGKGGEIIKNLTDGKEVFMEVDKASGDIHYGASSLESLEQIRSELQEIVNSNCICRMPLNPTTAKDQYRVLKRSSVKTELAGKVRIDLDEEKSCLVLTGKHEELAGGKLAVEEFMANNQIGEVPITDEDRDALMSGGKSSKIVKLSEEFNVKMNVDREKHVCFIRGSKENVDSVVDRLKQFLQGGNGHSVAKLTVTEQVVGTIIGKQGRTRHELEQKHDGVTINISKSHVVTIRGPEESVSCCKVEIGKMVASARVSQSIPLSDMKKDILEKKEFKKKVTQYIPVHISIDGDQIVVRGSFYDVQDAVSLINEMITGEYKTIIDLDSSHFLKVRNTCRDPSHIKRMEVASGGKIYLDLSAGSIVISGKRANVKKAKDQVYSFLDFILPGVIERVKITKPLYLSVGQASVLAEISGAAGGVTVYLDRDLGLIVVRSNTKEMLQQATKLLMDKILDAERLAYVWEFNSDESWLLNSILGKNGSNVSSLRSKNPTCKIDVSKEARTVTVVGDTEETVANVKAAIEEVVKKARQETTFVKIPEDYVPQFVGKGGANVKALSAKHGADIQRIKNGEFNFRISGDALKVEATKVAVEEWLSQKEEANSVLTFHLEKGKDAAFIIGEKGAFVRSVEEEFKCKVDIDRKALIVNIKGATEEIREAAAQKLKDKIVEERKKLALAQASKENQLDLSQQSPNSTAEFSSILNKRTMPDAVSSDEEKPRSRTSTQESLGSNEFPPQPIGIVAPKTGVKGGKNKRIDSSINEGTEEGKSLFAMLLEED